jgi:two-component sensor histidine kinase
VRRDGKSILTESRQVVLRDRGEDILAILEINRDITERRRAEDSLKQTVAALESALNEKTVLLKEIHHRVKNNLAVIASLLSLKGSMTRNAKVRAALKSSEERVHSMALIHEHLYGGGQLDRVDFRDYTKELVQEQLSASEGSADQISTELAIDPIQLDIERAVPCALILNELLSNSLKHAFPNASGGTIRISFHEAAPGVLELVFEDNGIGLPPDGVVGEDTKSLGLRIVGILARQLGGTLQQENGCGSRFVLRFPSRGAAEHAQADERQESRSR